MITTSGFRPQDLRTPRTRSDGVPLVRTAKQTSVTDILAAGGLLLFLAAVWVGLLVGMR